MDVIFERVERFYCFNQSKVQGNFCVGGSEVIPAVAKLDNDDNFQSGFTKSVQINRLFLLNFFLSSFKEISCVQMKTWAE
jgi:hypothetical protein